MQHKLHLCTLGPKKGLLSSDFCNKFCMRFLSHVCVLRDHNLNALIIFDERNSVQIMNFLENCLFVVEENTQLRDLKWKIANAFGICTPYCSTLSYFYFVLITIRLVVAKMNIYKDSVTSRSATNRMEPCDINSH